MVRKEGTKGITSFATCCLLYVDCLVLARCLAVMDKEVDHHCQCHGGERRKAMLPEPCASTSGIVRSRAGRAVSLPTSR